MLGFQDVSRKRILSELEEIVIVAVIECCVDLKQWQHIHRKSIVSNSFFSKQHEIQQLI